MWRHEQKVLRVFVGLYILEGCNLCKFIRLELSHVCIVDIKYVHQIQPPATCLFEQLTLILAKKNRFIVLSPSNFLNTAFFVT